MSLSSSNLLVNDVLQEWQLLLLDGQMGYFEISTGQEASREKICTSNITK
jgi:hypothetical protein